MKAGPEMVKHVAQLIFAVSPRWGKCPIFSLNSSWKVAEEIWASWRLKITSLFDSFVNEFGCRQHIFLLFGKVICFPIDFVLSLQVRQMTNIVGNHFSVLTEVKGRSLYLFIVFDWEWGPHVINNTDLFFACLQCIGPVRSSCFPILYTVMKATHFIMCSCSCVLSSVLHGPTAQLVYDLLCAENKFPVSHSSPLNSHSSSLRTVHPPLPRLSVFLFFSVIIPHIYSPRRPACSMTSGLSPWRTNHAFHSGSKREVSLFCVFFFLHFSSYLHGVACWIYKNVPSCW